MKKTNLIKTINIKNNLASKNFNQKNTTKNQYHSRFHKPNYGVKSRKPLEDDINLSL